MKVKNVGKELRAAVFQWTKVFGTALEGFQEMKKLHDNPNDDLKFVMPDEVNDLEILEKGLDLVEDCLDGLHSVHGGFLVQIRLGWPD